MASNFVGTLPSTGRESLGAQIGQAIQPAAQAYAQFLAETPKREKQEVEEYVNRVQALGEEGRQVAARQLQEQPELREKIQQYAPGVLAENEEGVLTINMPTQWQFVDSRDGYGIFTDLHGNIKATAIPDKVDMENRNVQIVDGRIVVHDDKGQVISNEPLQEIRDIMRTEGVNEDGEKVIFERTYFSDGSYEDSEIPIGMSEELLAQERAFEHEADMRAEDREFEGFWRNEELEEQRRQFYDSLDADKEKFDISTALELARIRQTDEHFNEELEQRAKQWQEEHDLQEEHTSAIIQDMNNQLDLAERKFDFTREEARKEYRLREQQLGLEQDLIDMQLEQLGWDRERFEAEMGKYESYGAVFDPNTGQIIGVRGRRKDPDTGEWVTEDLDHVPSDIANLMVQQQHLNMQEMEEEDLIKAQDYAGLASLAADTVGMEDSTRRNEPYDWTTTLHRYANKYTEGRDDVTVEEAVGRIAFHAMAQGWLDTEAVPKESFLRTDEAINAFNDEMKQWNEANPEAEETEVQEPEQNQEDTDLDTLFNPTFTINGEQQQMYDNPLQGLTAELINLLSLGQSRASGMDTQWQNFMDNQKESYDPNSYMSFGELLRQVTGGGN